MVLTRHQVRMVLARHQIWTAVTRCQLYATRNEAAPVWRLEALDLANELVTLSPMATHLSSTSSVWPSCSMLPCRSDIGAPV